MVRVDPTMQNRGRVGSMLDYETAVKFKNNLSPYRYSGVANLLFFEIPEIPCSLVLVLPIESIEIVL